MWEIEEIFKVYSFSYWRLEVLASGDNDIKIKSLFSRLPFAFIFNRFNTSLMLSPEK